MTKSAIDRRLKQLERAVDPGAGDQASTDPAGVDPKVWARAIVKDLNETELDQFIVNLEIAEAAEGRRER